MSMHIMTTMSLTDTQEHPRSTYLLTYLQTHVLECERITRQAAQANNIVFYINGIALDNVTECKYLGCIISADDWDDAAVSYNIKKAMKAWFGMQRILSANGADPHTMARFYLAVVQAKLLFGSETWVLSQCLLG